MGGEKGFGEWSCPSQPAAVAGQIYLSEVSSEKHHPHSKSALLCVWTNK